MSEDELIELLINLVSVTLQRTVFITDLVKVYVLHSHVLQHGRLLTDVGGDDAERRAALMEHSCDEKAG